MSGFVYGNRTKVHREYIKGRFRRSLNDASNPGSKIVSAICIHQVNHKTSGAASTQWLHKGNRQSFYKAGIRSKPSNDIANSLNQIIHDTGFPKNAYGHEDSNQIGDDLDCYIKTFFCAFDKIFININLTYHR